MEEKIELFSQAGMEESCIRFIKRINDESKNGTSFNSSMQPRYEGCSFERKSLLVSFPVESYMRNPVGVMHGGALSGALDIAMGSLTFYMAGEFVTPTINLNVSFLRPVPVGKRLFVESTCLSCGKTMAYATAKAWLEGQEDKILGSAAGTYYTASGMR